MTKREIELQPVIGMKVFHEAICNGKECTTVVGIRKEEVELEGDYSGGTHNVIGQCWFPIKGLFRLIKVCIEVEKYGNR